MTWQRFYSRKPIKKLKNMKILAKGKDISSKTKEHWTKTYFLKDKQNIQYFEIKNV
jgi:hypothetical protein